MVSWDRQRRPVLHARGLIESQMIILFGLIAVVGALIAEVRAVSGARSDNSPFRCEERYAPGPTCITRIIS